jgi:hypothetical protein
VLNRTVLVGPASTPDRMGIQLYGTRRADRARPAYPAVGLVCLQLVVQPVRKVLFRAGCTGRGEPAARVLNILHKFSRLSGSCG